MNRVFQSIFRVLPILGCLCFFTIAAETTPNRQTVPHFVANIIAHVPQNFNASLVEQYKEELESIPYYIKHDSRGVVEEPTFLDAQGTGLSIDPTLNPLFQKLSTEAFFGSSTYRPEDAVERYMHVAILLNRMESLDPERNSSLRTMCDDLNTSLNYQVLATLWRPQWMKIVKIESRGKQSLHHRLVTLEDVAKYYQELRAKNPELAYAFLEKNEKSVPSTIIPYRELRQALLASDATRDLVRTARGELNCPVYMAFMDADTESFCPEDIGVFTAYQNAIAESSQELHFLTSGYCPSPSENPYAQMAVSLDLSVRCALGRVLPLAPYYPEPNTIIRVLDDQDTLEGQFCKIKTGHAKYTSPQEIPELIKSLLQTRSRATSHAQFLSEGALATKIPARFLENKKDQYGKKSPKKYIEKAFDIQAFTRQDFIELRNTSQSHLKIKDWGGYVYKSLQGQMRGGSITISQSGAPGAIVKNRQDQLLTSLLGTVYKGYSPVDRIIRGVGEEGYNFFEYWVHVIQTYTIEMPAPLDMTYGQRKSTRLTGNLLRKEVTSYPKLDQVINLFYTTPVSAEVHRAAQQCGLAERDVLIHYYVTTYQPPLQVSPLRLALPKVEERPALDSGVNVQEAPRTEATAVTNREDIRTLPYNATNFRRLLDYLSSHLSTVQITTMAGYARQHADRNFQSMQSMRARNLERRWDSLIAAIPQNSEINIQELLNAVCASSAA